MASKISWLIIIFVMAVSILPGASKNHEMVVYWGQNWINKKPLSHYCLHSRYDKIILSFLQVFFDKKNKDKMPGISFASGCTGPVAPGYTTLLRCPEIEQGIKICQQRGIPVLLSLGGYVGEYGFKNKNEVGKFASRIWNLFLNGNLEPELRPFGTAVLDGIDLNIEKGQSYGYSDFVAELNRYMSLDGTKEYIITTPPGCPFPDRFLGPDSATNKGTALTNHGEMFSDIYVQFYCCGCVPGSSTFWWRFHAWIGYAMEVRRNNGGIGPRVYIGLTAHPDASGVEGGQIYHKSADEIASIYNWVKNNPAFGGFMMWNAGFDDMTRKQDGNQAYGDQLIDILKG